MIKLVTYPSTLVTYPNITNVTTFIKSNFNTFLFNLPVYKDHDLFVLMVVSLDRFSLYFIHPRSFGLMKYPY